MENSFIVLIVAGITGVVIGIGIALLFLRSGSGNQASASKVEAQLKDYQEQVENHFAKTSELIDDLTNSYKNVFEHLSESAQSLLTEEQIQQQIENRKGRQVTLSYLQDASHEVDTQTPSTEEAVVDDTERV
ncbi:YhcB family protein [Marinicella sp. W31]|uniref:YhcB family protein n=1 Tax=Marinicella sp. W31 TaxID=3023713 RepID=UPI0037574DA9